MNGTFEFGKPPHGKIEDCERFRKQANWPFRKLAEVFHVVTHVRGVLLMFVFRATRKTYFLHKALTNAGHPGFHSWEPLATL